MSALTIHLAATDEPLDLLPGAALRLSKAVDRVDELGRITQEAALALRLPPTARNLRLLAAADLNVLRGQSFTVPVVVRQAGQAQNGITALALVGFTETDGYEADPYGDDWQEGLEGVTLAELDLGTFRWDLPTVEAAWDALRGEADVLPALADFGAWYSEDGGTVVLEDLRLLVSVRAALRAAFAAVGWGLECPHLEFGDGRFWYAYLSGERWSMYPSKRTDRFVDLEVSNVTLEVSVAPRIPWEVVANPGGNYKIGALGDGIVVYDLDSLHETEARVQQELTFTVRVNAAPTGGAAADAEPYVRVWFTRLDYPAGGAFTAGTQYSTVLERVYPVPFGSGERTISDSITHYNVSNSAGSRHYVFINYVGLPEEGDPTVHIDTARLTYRPDPSHYGRGDAIEVGATLSAEITALELVTAVAHLCNAKFTTDLARRTVVMDVPYPYRRTNAPEVTVPGFYQPGAAPLDLRRQTVPGSVTWKRAGEEGARFVEYDLAGDHDAAVTDTDRARWRRRVDRGTGDRSRTDRRENPLFEPTAARSVKAADIGGDGLALPALLSDTIDGNPGPRILVYYGLGVGSYRLEGQARSRYPVLGFAASPLEATGLVIEPLTFAGYAADLYQRFYAREATTRDGLTVEVLLLGGDVTYDALTFRRPILIGTALQGDIEVWPGAVRDHERGSDAPLLLEGGPVNPLTA